MWIKPDLLGPQKGPATQPRLKAQWRQIDRENREAIAVRIEWMHLLGFDGEEIADACKDAFDLDLVDELAELVAAKMLAKK
jgi:hypothetical protein